MPQYQKYRKIFVIEKKIEEKIFIEFSSWPEKSQFILQFSFRRYIFYVFEGQK